MGIDRKQFGPEGVDFYNSAVLVTPDGSWCKPGRREQSYYDKMHLVVFGEYMPFVNKCAWLQSLSPLGTSASAGERPKCLMLKNICLAPNICYETVLPQVIRNHLVSYAGRPGAPDPGQRDQRRLVLGLERVGAAPWPAGYFAQWNAGGRWSSRRTRAFRPRSMRRPHGRGPSETKTDPRRRSPRPPRKLVSAPRRLVRGVPGNDARFRLYGRFGRQAT